MKNRRLAMKNSTALLALITAGSLWGVTVALSKLSLGWLDPSWLSAMRFLVAAPILAVIGRRGLRDALTPSVFVSGALGFGVVILLQNAGINHTSVSHAAIIVGALPVIVALVTAGVGNGSASPLAWLGYGIALAGIMLVAKGGGGGATISGDTLVFASVVISGLFIAMQPRVLRGRDAAAVTAVQFAAGAAVSLPVALISGGLPHAPTASGPVLAFVALALVGTILPFWLFAYGQARVPAQMAGAFVNFEPLVGALVGWVAFSDPVGPWQIFGAVAVVSGILVSLLPLDLNISWPRHQRTVEAAQQS
ncbi:MAG TPA: DMT family transporter [Solirubrobacteraceae bacterium]|jgi:drug/metabolite transporter (DMT)-like permease|nr:DMT family transporter [Solirubrobacteraceae bacterium]